MPVCYNYPHRRPSTRQLQHIAAPLDALESSLDGEHLSILRCLRRRALDQSLPVYLVGGPVRDVLMGTAIKDLDFVVEGDGPAMASQLAAELGGEVLTHERFGTATLVLGSCRVDAVTARREVYPHPAALPRVSAGTISDDLARRDFSVNALALPLGERRPEVLDPHGGVDDIRHGLVRILHPNSFVDDPTRILRAVRYEQRLGFRIDDETQAHLRDAIAQGHLGSLTGDRLRHELERTLQEDRPGPALKRAAELGILAAIHPSLGDEKAVARLAALAAGGSTLGAPQAAGAGLLFYVASLAYPLSAGQGEAVIHRLNMPNAWAGTVRDAIMLREREEELAAPSLRRSQLVHLAEGFRGEAVLAVSRLTDSAAVAQRLAEYLNELRFVAPALNGRDLLAMGAPAGPMVGRVLRELREARLDGTASTEEEERRLARDILARQGGPPGHG